jgi:hypothetical protein
MRTKTSPAIPQRYYLGLSSTEPTLAGGNVTEPGTGTGYARIELDSLSEPDNGGIVNSGSIDFNESTAAWGTMTHFVIFDAMTGGNLLMYGKLSTSRTVEAATIMTIKAGSLNLSVVNPGS